MHRRIVSLPQIRVTPATSAADWQAAREVLSELFDWLDRKFHFDAISMQDGAEDEATDPAAFYSFPRGMFLLGRVDGEVAGALAIRFLPDGETVELKRAWVRAAYRGTGITESLLARSLDASRALGASRVVLETDPRVMPRAVSICRRYGFREGQAYSSLSQRIPTLLTMEKRVA